MGGFTTPGLLFVGASGRGEMAYAQLLLERLWATGDYDTYVEPCVGGFSMVQIAVTAGFPIAGTHTSDVTLFSSVLGYYLSGRPLDTLAVTVDGDTVDLSGSPEQQAARILTTQLRLRLEAKPDAVYWHELRRDLVVRLDDHEQSIIRRLRLLHDRLAGLSYIAAGLVEHITEHLNNPRALVHAVPPTYRGGYEKFFDTGDRLAWAEPDYGIFDPDDGWRDLWSAIRDASATFVGMRECEPGTRFWPDGPVYANQQRTDQYGYYVTNRTERVLDLMGGRKVRAGRSPSTKVRPLPQPIIPADRDIGRQSTVDVRAIDHGQARYYKSLWLHGNIGTDNAEGNYAVLVDGYVAGVGAVNASPINRPNAGRLGAGSRSRGEAFVNALLLVYAVGPPHDRYRLTRLATAVALYRPVLDPLIAVTSAGTLASVVATHVWTLEMSRYPEAKGMRGLMKLRTRTVRDDGRYNLLYEAPIGDLTLPEILDRWLTKEEQWRKTRQQQQPQPFTSAKG